MNVQPEAVAEARDKYGDSEHVPGELIVKVNGGMESGLMSDFASEYGAKVLKNSTSPKGFLRASVAT